LAGPPGALVDALTISIAVSSSVPVSVSAVAVTVTVSVSVAVTVAVLTGRLGRLGVGVPALRITHSSVVLTLAGPRRKQGCQQASSPHYT
jgi:hypothetical protein